MNGYDLKNIKIGLVLSGGGVKGLAHVGVIKALTERGIFPNAISGVSAGAIVGALYANSVSADDMLEFFKETPLLKYNFVTINKSGLFDTDRYRVFLEPFFPENTFESLQRELFITATNLEKGTSEIFSKGPLIQTILASAALPPVFSPEIIKGTMYSDGGMMNNFPIEPLVGKTDFIFGCYASTMKEVGKEELSSSYQLTQRANLLMLHANTVDKLSIPDILFRPSGLEHIGVLDKSGLEKAFEIGYEHAAKVLEKLFKNE